MNYQEGGGDIVNAKTQIRGFWDEIVQSDKDSLARAYISDELLDPKDWPHVFRVGSRF